MPTTLFSRRLPVAAFGLAAAATTLCALPLAAAYHPTGQEQQAVAKLIDDLKTIGAGSDVTAAEKQALAADFALFATGTTKPSEASLEQLADDLASALADGSVSTVEMTQLVLDLDAVVNSAGLSTAQATKFIADAKAILDASGVNAADVQLIASDLAAVAASLQTNFLVSNASFALVSATTREHARGQAQLTSSIKNDGRTTAVLSLETLGLTAGTYTVNATVAAGGAPVTLGTLKVFGFGGLPGAGAAAFGASVGAPFPAGFDPAGLTAVTIADAGGTTQLTGTLTNAAKLTRLGNFRLAPGAADPAALGNVAFAVTAKASTTKDHFLLYAWKLPVSATLTLKANGVAVGTVTTSTKGRLLITTGKVSLPVKADGQTPLLTPTPLPAGVDLSTLTLLELDDAQGQIVATAGFSS